MTVSGEFKWLPKQMGSFFIDAQDYDGIEMWYNRVKDLKEELTPKN